VVIAIIAILAAILFPVFAQAREKARAITCISNMKELGLATLMYTQDYDEHTPFGEWSNGTGWQGWYSGWAGLIYPYVKSAGVYVCPDDPNPYDLYSYAMNNNFEEPDNGGSDGQSIASWAAPASTIMYFEQSYNYEDPAVVATQGWGEAPGDMASGFDSESASGNGGGVINGMSSNPANPGNKANGYSAYGETYATGFFPGWNAKNTVASGNWGGGTPPQFDGTARHSAGSNYAFCDGHAKWLQASRVSAGGDESLSEGDGSSAGFCSWGLGASIPTEYLGQNVTCPQGSWGNFNASGYSATFNEW
jgi:prepilin-type processing-associated H-X9-DG protein